MKFYKYQGTGNDFILIDNRDQLLNLSQQQVALLCDRRFGIGADGLMLLENEAGYDFKMVYFNSDGNESTMCGNGGRCIVAFAHMLNIIASEAYFLAIDGPHKAHISENGIVSLQMKDVTNIEVGRDFSVLDTGSPHYIQWILNEFPNIVDAGRAVRYNTTYAEEGINVNFVKKTTEGLYVRTYERGVEGETLSCGTGVTAAAIAASGTETGEFSTNVDTLGGKLSVSFSKIAAGVAKNVWLTGPAQMVFEGTSNAI